MVLALLQDQIKIHMKIKHEAQNWVIQETINQSKKKYPEAEKPSKVII